jgi:hypothetical protein
MIILDENIPDSQRQLLRGWRIRVHQIGHEIGRSGMKDKEIIPLLHNLRAPTFSPEISASTEALFATRVTA